MNKNIELINLRKKIEDLEEQAETLEEEIIADSGFKNGDKVKVKGANKYGFIRNLQLDEDDYTIITKLMKEKPDGTCSTHGHDFASLRGINEDFLDYNFVLLEALIKVDN